MEHTETMSRINDEARASKNSKNGSRGSVNNSGRLSRFNQAKSSPQAQAEWSVSNPGWLAAVVMAATNQGMEISFSLSSDGGAHGLKLYDFKSGERATLWFNGDADLDAELEKVFLQLQEG